MKPERGGKKTGEVSEEGKKESKGRQDNVT